jgi:ATP-dependent Clp protease adapter protein ClpS
MEKTVLEKNPTDSDTIDAPNTVILFNDNIHSFEEVASQLVKAISCSYEQGEDFALQVHTKGKCAVYEGSITECLNVSSTLEEIGLHTQIET